MRYTASIKLVLYCPYVIPHKMALLSQVITPPSYVQAACCIVSRRANEDFDAYVLSESSLFVYPERLMLKTCGTTQLLAAVPLLLEFAQKLDMCACRIKYSRASFLFPEKQVPAFKSCLVFAFWHACHLLCCCLGTQLHPEEQLPVKGWC